MTATGADLSCLVASRPAAIGITATATPKTMHLSTSPASLGALKALPYGLVAGLSAQYVERAPRAIELFAKGPHDASGTFEIGDPNLKKEAASSVEASLRKIEGRWRFDATVYYTRYSNFIYRQETGLRCAPENLVPLGNYAPDPGTMAARAALFAATRCEGPVLRAEDELGLESLHLVEPAKMAELVANGEIEDAGTLIAYYRFSALQERAGKP